MVGYIGVSVLAIGGVGLMVSTKGRRGWYNWTRGQKIGASVSAGLVVVGLILMDMDS